MRRAFGPWNKCERCWFVALSLVLVFGIGVFWVLFISRGIYFFVES